MPDHVMGYAVAYQGNDNAPLCMEPTFATLTEAQKATSEGDGCGLHYGAFVLTFRVTREDVRRYDEIRETLRSQGAARRGEPAHIQKARARLLEESASSC